MALAVEGLAELNRAFRRSEARLDREFRPALKDAAEPVRDDAERLVGQTLRNLRPGAPWTGMRVGVTAHSVYVVPKQRGRFTRQNRGRYARPRFKFPIGSQMNVALDRNIAGVERSIDALLGRMETDFGS